MHNKGIVNKKQGNTATNQSFFAASTIAPILFLAVLFFLTFVARVILSPIIPRIEADLNIGHGQAGSLFLFISIGYFFAMAGAGYISARIRHKRTIALSVSSVGIALCSVSFCTDLWSMRAAVFGLGLAAGLYLPSGITTLTEMVTPEHWGKALSIHEIAPNLGFIAAPLFAECLLIWFSWKHGLIILGVIALLLGLAFARFGRGGDLPGHAPSLHSIRAVAAKTDFWIMLILFALGISSTLGVYAMLPVYLVNDSGFSTGTANTMIAFSRVFGLAAALVSGWLTDRVGAKRTIRYALFLTGLATIGLGAFSAPILLIAFVFIQAMLGSCFFPAGFTALSAIVTADMRNVVVSLAIPLAFIFGGGVIPLLIGLMGDAHMFTAGFILTGGLILSGSALSFLLNGTTK